MRKFAHLDTLDRTRRPPSRAPLVVLFFLVLIAIPPLFELGKIELASLGLFGLAGRVDTPLLDFLSKQWEASHGEIRDWFAPYLVNRHWSPRVVIPLAFFLTAMGGMMLRRGH